MPQAPLFLLNDLFTRYYRTLKKADANGRLVAWSALGFPKHVLFALGMIPVYPQFHVAFQSSRGLTGRIIRDVEGRYEIPHDICGEVKSMIGTILNGEKLAFKLPEPDLIASCNSTCGATAKGFQFLRKHLGIPLYFCDYPCVTDSTPGAHSLRYVRDQIDAFVLSAEEAHGVRLDRKKYRRILSQDFMALEIWTEIVKLCARKPAPVDAMDLYFFILPFFIMEFENDDFLDLLIRLYNDLYRRCEESSGESTGKEIRLLWDLLPVYHKTGFFKKAFAEHDASVVMSTYLTGALAYPDGFEPKYGFPLKKEAVASTLQAIPDEEIADRLNYSLVHDGKLPLEFRKHKIRRMISDFAIDGVVMHMDRSCRPVSLPQFELCRYVEEDLGVPVLLFDADSMDERYFAGNQVLTRIEAFMERLAVRKE